MKQFDIKDNAHRLCLFERNGTNPKRSILHFMEGLSQNESNREKEKLVVFA